MNIRQRKILTSVSIRFKNMINSPAIKVTLVIAVLASCLMSFFPAVRHYLSDDTLKVYSELELDLSEYDGTVVHAEKAEDADISVTRNAQDGTCTVYSATQDGYNAAGFIAKAIQMKLLPPYPI